LLVADAAPVTLPQMIIALRAGLGRRPGLIPMPAALLRTALNLAGRSEIYERLAGSLVVDSSALQRLGWTPRLTTHVGLAGLMRDALP
jgi:UDP-glucose 4-epimerase